MILFKIYFFEKKSLPILSPTVFILRYLRRLLIPIKSSLESLLSKISVSSSLVNNLSKFAIKLFKFNLIHLNFYSKMTLKRESLHRFLKKKIL